MWIAWVLFGAQIWRHCNVGKIIVGIVFDAFVLIFNFVYLYTKIDDFLLLQHNFLPIVKLIIVHVIYYVQIYFMYASLMLWTIWKVDKQWLINVYSTNYWPHAQRTVRLLLPPIQSPILGGKMYTSELTPQMMPELVEILEVRCTFVRVQYVQCFVIHVGLSLPLFMCQTFSG